MNDAITLEQAQRIRKRIGDLCEQHALDCGACASCDVFICDEMRQLLALKFKWLRRLLHLTTKEEAA